MKVEELLLMVPKNHPVIISRYEEDITLIVKDDLTGEPISSQRIATDFLKYCEPVALDLELPRIFNKLIQQDQEVNIEPGFNSKGEMVEVSIVNTSYIPVKDQPAWDHAKYNQQQTLLSRSRTRSRFNVKRVLKHMYDNLPKFLKK